MPSFHEVLRSARDAVKAVASMEERIRLMEAIDMLSDLRERNGRLKRKNRRLRARLASREAVERIGGAFFILEADGSRTGPICPSCHASDGIVMLLEGVRGGASCARCKTRYPGVPSPLRAPGKRGL